MIFKIITNISSILAYNANNDWIFFKYFISTIQKNFSTHRNNHSTVITFVITTNTNDTMCCSLRTSKIDFFSTNKFSSKKARYLPLQWIRGTISFHWKAKYIQHSQQYLKGCLFYRIWSKYSPLLFKRQRLK